MVTMFQLAVHENIPKLCVYFLVMLSRVRLVVSINKNVLPLIFHNDDAHVRK